jgi:hypothetical protein
MGLPPLACWESKVAAQEYKIRRKRHKKHKRKVQSSSDFARKVSCITLRVFSAYLRVLCVKYCHGQFLTQRTRRYAEIAE